MATINKSEFENICKEDSKQFEELLNEFEKVDLVNINGLYEISKKALICSSRWNDISSNSKKIAQQYGLSKTEFSDWTYHKYSLLKELHITTRSWYNNAIKDYELNRMIKGD